MSDKVKIGEASVPMFKLPEGSMMNLHHELGSGTHADGRKIRFCQHINGLCFWLSIGDDMFELRTEDLMNGVAQVATKKGGDDGS